MESPITETMFGLQDLFGIIRKTSIDLRLWGRGEAKTATHLVDEVIKRECTLELINGVLYRNIEVVSIAIYYYSKKSLHLQEKEQIFSDGRPRFRKLPNNCSVSDKVEIGKETPLKAALRDIPEELQELRELNTTITADQLRFIKTIQREDDSVSYPGIKTRKTIHIFECVFTEEQFNPDGYTENQPDKTNHHHWVPITSQPA